LTAAVEVAAGVWLGRHLPAAPGRASGPWRLSADRRGALRALAGALAALPPGFAEDVAVSLSHSEGVGVALVAACGRRLGVDVVRVARVGERHARAILTTRERARLRGDARFPPAAAWALKEAAAKATGAPAWHFPERLLIRSADPRASVVDVLGSQRRQLVGGWSARAGFLCAWLIGPRRS